VLFQLLTSFVEIAHPEPSTDVSAPAPRVEIALRGVGSLWKVFMNPVMKLQLEVSVCSRGIQPSKICIVIMGKNMRP
jgi:hypothetical protein